MATGRPAGLLIALLIALIACAPPSQEDRRLRATGDSPEPRGPKVMVASIFGVPPSLDFRFVVSSNNAGYNEMGGLYMSKLTVYNDEGVLVPQLADRSPTLENGLWRALPDDTMETRLTIRPGTLWHDGTPVTTKDILFNDEVYLDKELPQIVLTPRTFVDRMVAVDDGTISIIWKQPYIQADVFSPFLLPTHLLEASYRELNTSLTTHPWLSTEYVGTGPFKYKDFQPGAWVTLTAFDQYVLGRPKIDEIQVKFVPDTNTVIANVLSGAVDLTMGRGVSVAQGKQLKDGGWDGLVDITPNNWIYMFGQYIDPIDPVIADKRFLRGVWYAQNRQEYVDQIQFGYGGVADIMLAPSDPEYARNIARVEAAGLRVSYDPRKATQWFEQAGVTRGPDGLLRHTDTGQRLPPLEFRTTQDVQLSIQVLGAQAADLRLAGMDINEVVIPAARTADRPYRVTRPAFEQLRGGLGPATLIGYFHSSKVPTPQNNYTTGNNPRYNNAQWDSLLDRYAVTIPIPERNQVMSDMMLFMAEELPQMPILYDASTVLVNKRILGAGAHHGGQNGIQGWNPETWDIRS